MQVREKRSSESVLYDVDCSILLAAGEIITSVTSMAADLVTTPPIAFGAAAISAAPITYTDVFGSTRTAPAATVIQTQISGGKIAAGAQVQDYLLRFKFATNLNPVVEATVLLRVNDTPA